MGESNGLILGKIKSSEPKPVNDQDEIKNFITTDSLAVAWLDYRVLVGRYEDNNFVFHDNHTLDFTYIQRIRIFNRNEELLLWRSDNGHKGRYRKDEGGDEIDVIDAKQALFGTDREVLQNGFTKIFEKRGTEIILPFTGLDVKDKTKDKRVFVKTRNYIDYNEAHQATYVDCRFMGFWNNGKEGT